MQMCEGIQVFFHGLIFLFCEPRDEISLAIIFIFFFFFGNAYSHIKSHRH